MRIKGKGLLIRDAEYKKPPFPERKGGFLRWAKVPRMQGANRLIGELDWARSELYETFTKQFDF